MRTLLIDNYDSFTYNLFQLISVVNGVEPVVLRNDEESACAGLDFDSFDNVVIAPGPGRPDRRRDFGISARVVRETRVPLLGICLGHQGVVLDAGGEIGPAPTPRHGFLDSVRHDEEGLFDGVPQDFTVVRYHSLCAIEPLPADLAVTARTPDGVVMAVRHRHRPQWGLQFHPESVAAEYGATLLRNFAKFTAAQHRPITPRPSTRATAAPTRAATGTTTYRARTLRIDRAVDTEATFDRLYAQSRTAFWLDSEHVEPGLDRFSFLGDASGPLAEVIGYDVTTGTVRVHRGADVTDVPSPIFDYLSGQLSRRSIDCAPMPFDFTGGYVGYFGYETKADCGSPNTFRSDFPDARLIFTDRFIAVDHVANATYLIALDDADSTGSAQEWIEKTCVVLESVPDWSNPAQLFVSSDTAAVESMLRRGHDRYLADIADCDRALRAGESYEICLTDSVQVDATEAGIDFYRTLRRCNPAPYAAYLRFDDVEVACSSPERFLKLDRCGVVESKPIKGTAPRGATPAEDDQLRRALAADPKTRAENLMIVDLLRNDLGRVCEVGTVHVPELMVTETYATLHQLVSTIRGTLRPGLDAIDCLRACFPGGSMTGAPKLRTMEIIDTLETQARGVYSGTIGFLGLNRTADLNIVIRTAVLANGRWHIGAGGAIVLDSVAEDEYREMVLKAAAAARACSPGPFTTA
ncbi:aminodeoxychorismate synthase component I [Aldersonia sp. NBC_00410]|uniref:aminodeoxychorismate synthase component I n=1 Tax=Aldersonia sp. NBC_00410 TaxID=2975954 RepID=UPI0022573F6F|nr:aminodeoxychorismate synthase component I [Aldersonia sp. NBC_00410]MCX5042670.1 aminodeoxychorismate synthase component I [Aldersonia sp. NBC_00410]